jgi:hypothetical protein
MKFRAVISKETTVYFSLRELFDESYIPISRELLIPWLRRHEPDRFVGKFDQEGCPVYENDIVEVYEYLEGKIWEQQTHIERVVFIGTGFNITRPYCHQSLYSNEVKVIGNHHLNPELYTKQPWEIDRS